MTGRTRREIDLARGFFNYSSNQQLIDDAVREFLALLGRKDPRYKAAVDNLAAKIDEEPPEHSR